MLAHDYIILASKKITEHDYDLALQHLASALELLGSSDSNLQITLLGCRGDIFFKLNCFDKAKAEYMKALELDCKNHPHEAAIFFNLGTTFFEQKEYKISLSCFETAVDLYTDQKAALKFQTKLYIGECLYLLGSLDEALPIFKQALEACDKTDIARLFGINYKLATAYREIKQFDSACIYAKNAYELTTQQDAYQYRYSCLVVLGDGYRAQNQFNDAFLIYEECFNLLPEHENNSKAFESVNAGDMLSIQDKHQRALDFYLQAIPLFDASQHLLKGDAALKCAITFQDNQQFDKAIHYFTLAAETLGESDERYPTIQIKLADSIKQQKEQESHRISVSVLNQNSLFTQSTSNPSDRASMSEVALGNKIK